MGGLLSFYLSIQLMNSLLQLAGDFPSGLPVPGLRKGQKMLKKPLFRPIRAKRDFFSGQIPA
jgi:hypothetical protein